MSLTHAVFFMPGIQLGNPTSWKGHRSERIDSSMCFVEYASMCMAMSSSSAVGSDSDNGNDGEGSAEEQFANLLSRSDQPFEPRKPLNPANNPDAPDVNPERLLDARPDGKAVGT